jgi:hypothetical protein
MCATFFKSSEKRTAPQIKDHQRNTFLQCRFTIIQIDRAICIEWNLCTLPKNMTSCHQQFTMHHPNLPYSSERDTSCCCPFTSTGREDRSHATCDRRATHTVRWVRAISRPQPVHAIGHEGPAQVQRRRGVEAALHHPRERRHVLRCRIPVPLPLVDEPVVDLLLVQPCSLRQRHLLRLLCTHVPAFSFSNGIVIQQHHH